MPIQNVLPRNHAPLELIAEFQHRTAHALKPLLDLRRCQILNLGAFDKLYEVGFQVRLTQAHTRQRANIDGSVLIDRLHHARDRNRINILRLDVRTLLVLLEHQKNHARALLRLLSRKLLVIFFF